MWENIPLKRNVSLCKRDGEKWIATASSGIAVTLLKGARTAQSTFGIPIPIFNTSTCSIKANSKLGQLILTTELLIWDEALMAHSHNIVAVDRMMRDMTKNDTFFGNKMIIFCGDPAKHYRLYRKIQGLS